MGVVYKWQRSAILKALVSYCMHLNYPSALRSVLVNRDMECGGVRVNGQGSEILFGIVRLKKTWTVLCGGCYRGLVRQDVKQLSLWPPDDSVEPRSPE